MVDPVGRVVGVVVGSSVVEGDGDDVGADDVGVELGDLAGVVMVVVTTSKTVVAVVGGVAEPR